MEIKEKEKEDDKKRNKKKMKSRECEKERKSFGRWYSTQHWQHHHPSQ
jgi:hypothetical protein